MSITIVLECMRKKNTVSIYGLTESGFFFSKMCMRKKIRSRYTVSRERISRPQNITVYALKFQLYTLSFRILNLTMETNVDEAPEVEATSSKSNKGKKLIPPWRDPVKGPILRTAMFKLALTSSVC